MKFYINIDKKYFFILLGVLVLGIGGIFVYGYIPSQIPNPGHGATDIVVDCPGGTVTDLNTCLGTLGGGVSALDQTSCQWTKWTSDSTNDPPRTIKCPVGFYVAGEELMSTNDNEHNRLWCCQS